MLFAMLPRSYIIVRLVELGQLQSSCQRFSRVEKDPYAHTAYSTICDIHPGEGFSIARPGGAKNLTLRSGIRSGIRSGMRITIDPCIL